MEFRGKKGSVTFCLLISELKYPQNFFTEYQNNNTNFYCTSHVVKYSSYSNRMRLLPYNFTTNVPY